MSAYLRSSRALDRGGMRRICLRGRQNVQKRYPIHAAGYNLGLIMRLLTGAGTPRHSLDCSILEPDVGLIAVILVLTREQISRTAT
jgi:hypothetical protein